MSAAVFIASLQKSKWNDVDLKDIYRICRARLRPHYGQAWI